MFRNCKRSLTIGFCFAALLCLGSSSQGHGRREQGHGRRENEPTDTKFGLRLTVEVSGEKFTLSGSPYLTVTLMNVSDSPIAIYKKLGWGGSASFSLSISDQHDDFVMPKMRDDDRYRAPFRSEDFITLHPGETIKQRRLLSFETKGIDAPGVYIVIVSYHSPVSRDLAPDIPNLWPKGNGVLQAKAVRFSVTE